MKRLGLLVLAACVMTAGCDDDPAGPSNLPIVFTANMRASNETAAVTGPESSGTGAATVTMNVTRDSAGNVTGGTVDMNWQVHNLPTTTNLILSHIHVGSAVVAGPVVVDTGMRATAPIAVSGDGTATFNVTGVTVSVDLLNQIIANPSGYYFNVHSQQHPAGVVRGQLTRVQ